MSIPLRLYRAYKLYKPSASPFGSSRWKHCSGLLGTSFSRQASAKKFCQALAGLSALLARHVDWKTLHTLDATHHGFVEHPIRILLGLLRHVVGLVEWIMFDGGTHTEGMIHVIFSRGNRRLLAESVGRIQYIDRT